MATCLAAIDVGETAPRVIERAAVRQLLDLLTERAPGRSVEVRVPPHAAVQVVGGSRHRRGTPPATVECDARTWIELATGRLTWSGAMNAGRVIASGVNSDLGPYLPVDPRPPISGGRTLAG